MPARDVLSGVQLSVVFRGPRGIWCQTVHGFTIGNLRGVFYDASLNNVFDG